MNNIFVIPVLDVKAGQAVHAVGGDRAHYRPVRSSVHPGSEPVALARAFRDRFGCRSVYLADLDAIGGAPPALSLYDAILDLGLTLWVDCGVTGPATMPYGDPRAVRERSIILILGLETLRGRAALEEIVARFPTDQLAFSLDLRDGRPLVETVAGWGTADPVELASLALEAGLRRVILLDLGRVGTGRGIGTECLLREIQRLDRRVEVVVGGGIAGPADVEAIARQGAAGVLVGSALHDGRISRLASS